ncbi:hypothetical protein [Streptomyces sioyaensis]|uniref:hypothetical protein n=1 Tax=Streptomyces sioyaensis TaxID=67364 RepID=UPI003D72553E
MVIPRAAGLFRRAVAQSLPGTYLSHDLAAIAPSRLPVIGHSVEEKMPQHEER